MGFASLDAKRKPHVGDLWQIVSHCGPILVPNSRSHLPARWRIVRLPLRNPHFWYSSDCLQVSWQAGRQDLLKVMPITYPRSVCHRLVFSTKDNLNSRLGFRPPTEDTMLEFRTKEQCEQFQMTSFGVSCATCGRSDQECPWSRRDELTIVARPTQPTSYPSGGIQVAGAADRVATPVRKNRWTAGIARFG